MTWVSKKLKVILVNKFFHQRLWPSFLGMVPNIELLWKSGWEYQNAWQGIEKSKQIPFQWCACLSYEFLYSVRKIHLYMAKKFWRFFQHSWTLDAQNCMKEFSYNKSLLVWHWCMQWLLFLFFRFELSVPLPWNMRLRISLQGSGKQHVFSVV